MIQAVQPRTRQDAQRDLVRRCAEGERAAQTQLFRDEVRRVHGLLHRVLGPHVGVGIEDLIQETFIRVFRALPQFRGESQLSTWIGGIAINVAYGHLRSTPPPTVHLELVPDVRADGPDAEQQLEARHGLRRVYQILDRMDPRLRVAFTLHVIDGRSMREIADLTSASLVATKTRVWRARRELAKRAKRDPFLLSFIEQGGGEAVEAEVDDGEAADGHDEGDAS
jgi:RNA polymerase sigma-70 factor (ECF subfamily)